MAEWISVKDRLPENTKDVLTYCYGEIGFGFYKEGRGWRDLEYKPIVIDYWMPLPEPPKGE